MASSTLFKALERRLRGVPAREQLHWLALASADIGALQEDWVTEPEPGSAIAEVVDQMDVHPGTAQLMLWAAVSLEALKDQQARIRDALEHGDAPEIRNLLAHLAYGIDRKQPRGTGNRLRPFNKPPGVVDRRAPWARRRKKKKEKNNAES